MPLRNLWTPDEFILVLDLYFKLPFGRLNKNTPEVKKLAQLMGRSDNSVALRLVNYAACDPYIIATGRHGMSSGRKTCQPYWDRFYNDREGLFFEAERIKAKLKNISLESHLELSESDFVGHERESVIKQRVDQKAFRQMILANYENQCAITGIDIPQLLVASHIKPWAVDVVNRLNPANGICLSPLYDRLFDKGLIGIREDYSIELSLELKQNSLKLYYDSHFRWIENKTIKLPVEHVPCPNFIEYHYQNIFLPHC